MFGRLGRVRSTKCASILTGGRARPSHAVAQPAGSEHLSLANLCFKPPLVTEIVATVFLPLVIVQADDIFAIWLGWSREYFGVVSVADTIPALLMRGCDLILPWQLTLAVIAEPGSQFFFAEFTSSQSKESHRCISFHSVEIYTVYSQETN